MQKYFLIWIPFAFCFFGVYAQNLYRFSQFNSVRSLYNPAAMGAEASLSCDLIYRNQWAGVDGAPQTAGFTGSYDLHSGMAVGLNFYNDRAGLNQTNSFTVNYCYRVEFNDQQSLSFGLGLGADNISWNLGEATLTQTGDPAFGASHSVFRFNGAVGLFYKSERFHAGVSIPQLFQNSISGVEKGFRPPRWHYYAMTGYVAELSDNFTLNPQALVKLTLNAPVQADVILRGVFSNIVGISLGYRTEYSLIAGIDFEIIRRLRLGYAFNHDVGKLARTKGMSHEVTLGIGVPYYSGKDGIGQQRYYNKKGGFRTNFRRKAIRRGR
ncbi:MAG: PorP/SprF family type IX secretion system membrane protein [Bacteroidota bacterium]|jgi:type IX secretion system PorP/SprF family membrane protein